jgi:rhodanese-related sulfurtransferase
MDREAVALNTRASRTARPWVWRALAAMAAALGALAAVAGDPQPSREVRGGKDAVGILVLAEEITKEKDHVTPLELAQWIYEQKAGLRIIDVRSGEARDEGHIPASEAIDLATLVTTSLRPTDTLVLYSSEGVHAGQAWVLLRALGKREVFFLRGGWAAWHDEVMHPTLEESASADAQSAFARAAELSRYFGGAPRIGVSQPRPTSAPIAHPIPRPRGC